MSVTLENNTRAVDGIPTIRDVSLTLERGTLSVLLGPTLADQTVKYWYEQTLTDGNLASQRKLANEKPPAETIDYDALTQICAPAPPRPKKV